LASHGRFAQLVTRLDVSSSFIDISQSHSHLFLTMDHYDSLLDEGFWNDDAVLMAAVQVVVNNRMAVVNHVVHSHHARHEEQRILQQARDAILTPNQDYRHFPRKRKRVFRHDEALHCIRRDYVGIQGDPETPIFKDRTFEMMFRLSRSRVQRIFEDVMNANHPFYSCRVDAIGQQGASLEAKILLPLKSFAYGVPPHTFSDYFQMSKPFAANCCDEYANAMRSLYSGEYLRVPDSVDMKSITKLHHEVHGVDGMFGSLDCMHNGWKICPKAWQASFKTGKETRGPTVVLEAAADYHLWFWHASFGYAGSLNDLNILNLSPLLESLVDGSFVDVEKSANVVPFHVDGDLFQRLFVLVDGIYPQYSRFVKGIHLPVTESEKSYTAWQEAARKDIERAFGVLQARFQVMARPFQSHSLHKISNIASACLIMHNMCVSDRIMDGNVYAVYDPACKIDEEEEQDAFEDLMTLLAGDNSNNDGNHEQRREEQGSAARIGLANTDNEFVVQHILARQTNWQELNDRQEHARLHSALLRLKGK
jgi:hypothetical protein